VCAYVINVRDMDTRKQEMTYRRGDLGCRADLGCRTIYARLFARNVLGLEESETFANTSQVSEPCEPAKSADDRVRGYSSPSSRNFRIKTAR